MVSLEIHVIVTETLGEHAQSVATVENRVAQFNRGDFSTFFCPGRTKDLSAHRYFDGSWIRHSARQFTKQYQDILYLGYLTSQLLN
jgi:hypothetical protein